MSDVMNSENKQIAVDRINFLNGGVLDGPMLLQTLYRLRNAEENITKLLSDSKQFFPYESTILLQKALTDVITFTSPGTITFIDFKIAPPKAIYRFGNLSNGIISLSDGDSIIMNMVPGEFIRLFKINNQWTATFGY